MIVLIIEINQKTSILKKKRLFLYFLKIRRSSTPMPPQILKRFFVQEKGQCAVGCRKWLACF